MKENHKENHKLSAIKELALMGHSRVEISEKLGLKLDLVSYYVRKYGISVKRKPKRMKVTALLGKLSAAWAGGATDKEMAAKFGICKESVAIWRRGAGLEPNRH